MGGTVAAAGSVSAWPSTSPTPRSRPRSSSASPRPRSSSTCGPRGAAPAGRWDRSSRRSPTPRTDRSSSSRSTSTRTPRSPPPSGCSRSPRSYALKGGQIVDGFIGAYPEDVVTQFVSSLLPTEGEQEIARLLEAGDEASLRQALELEPGNEAVVVALAELLVDDGRTDDALALLARIPETEPVRLLAARARLAQAGDVPAAGTNGTEPTADDYDEKLDALLDAGARRRGGAAGVRGHPRGHGPRGPPHGALPPAAHQPPVLGGPGRGGISPSGAGLSQLRDDLAPDRLMSAPSGGALYDRGMRLERREGYWLLVGGPVPRARTPSPSGR